MEQGISQFMAWIQGMGKHEILGFFQLYVVLPLSYFDRIMEIFSLIYRYRHGKLNHIKTSCIFV